MNDFSFTIKPIKEHEIDEVYEFLKAEFLPYEPLNQIIAVTYPKNEMACVRVINHGLSLKAVDSHDNIVGVALNADGRVIDEFTPTCEPLRRLYEFFDYFEEACKEVCKIDENLMTVQVLSVSHNYTKRGLGRALIEQTVALAREKGFTGVKVTCTSKFTALIASKLGWVHRYSLPYTDYRDDQGRAVYTPSQPHTHISLYSHTF